jgi:hypothetical protein
MIESPASVGGVSGSANANMEPEAEQGSALLVMPFDAPHDRYDLIHDV